MDPKAQNSSTSPAPPPEEESAKSPPADPPKDDTPPPPNGQKPTSPPSPSKMSTPASDATAPPPSPPPQQERTPDTPTTGKFPSLIPLRAKKSKHSTHRQSRDGEIDQRQNTEALVALGVVLGLVIAAVVGIVFYFLCRRRKRYPHRHNHGYATPPDPPLEPYSAWAKMRVQPLESQYRSKGLSLSPQTQRSFGKSNSFFSYKELSKATGRFSSKNLLGEGGFGPVHKGKLSDGREVAIKNLKEDSKQGEREFRAEVEIITRIHHRYLVSLVGYCIHENRRLLVYDYVPNNNLYFHLHGKGAPVLTWASRVKIAIGAARGIAYLHEDCQPRIIHRDIKSSNILLDNNFEARVSDFGLAKLAVDLHTHVTTRVMGTFGYLAPEYASSGKLTEKSDVYSYGVVLLELITGRKPLDTSHPEGDCGLVEWIRPELSKALDTNDFAELADPRLEGDYINGEMFKMVEVATACVRHAHKKRPKMGQVVRALDVIVSEDLTNGMKVGESGILNSEYKLLQKMAFENQELKTEFFNQCESSSEQNLLSSQSELSSSEQSKKS